jgi:hypothetical protein
VCYDFFRMTLPPNASAMMAPPISANQKRCMYATQISVVLPEVSPNSNSPERAHLADLLTGAPLKQDRTNPFRPIWTPQPPTRERECGFELIRCLWERLSLPSVVRQSRSRCLVGRSRPTFRRAPRRTSWQSEMERGAGSIIRSSPEPAVVSVHDGATDRQAHAEPAWLGSVEGHEHLLDV